MGPLLWSFPLPATVGIWGINQQVEDQRTSFSIALFLPSNGRVTGSEWDRDRERRNERERKLFHWLLHTPNDQSTEALSGLTQQLWSQLRFLKWLVELCLLRWLSAAHAPSCELAVSWSWKWSWHSSTPVWFWLVR